MIYIPSSVIGSSTFSPFNISSVLSNGANTLAGYWSVYIYITSQVLDKARLL